MQHWRDTEVKRESEMDIAYEQDQDTVVCCMCGKLVPEHESRTPIHEDGCSLDVEDHCIDCFVREGHAVLWRYTYMSTQGDVYTYTTDAPPDMPWYEVRKIVIQGIPMYQKMLSFKKVRHESKD